MKNKKIDERPEITTSSKKDIQQKTISGISISNSHQSPPTEEIKTKEMDKFHKHFKWEENDKQFSAHEIQVGEFNMIMGDKMFEDFDKEIKKYFSNGKINASK